MLAFVAADELRVRVSSLDFQPEETIRKVYAHFRKASDGCDGSTGFGFYGFLNVRSLFHIFQALGVRERKLVDLGAGDGKVLASAMRCNARSVVGYELPSNSAHKYIFDAVLRRNFPNPIQYNKIKPMAQWLAKDIDQVCFRHAIPRLSIFVLKISILFTEKKLNAKTILAKLSKRKTGK